MPRGSGNGYGGADLLVLGRGGLPDNRFYTSEVPATPRPMERLQRDYRAGNRILATQQGTYIQSVSVGPVKSAGVHTRGNRRSAGERLEVQPLKSIYLEDPDNVL